MIKHRIVFFCEKGMVVLISMNEHHKDTAFQKVIILLIPVL